MAIPAQPLRGGALITLSSLSASDTSPTMTNPGARGCKVVIDITAITGTSPTATVAILGYDAQAAVTWTVLQSAALTSAGVTVLTIYPGIAAAANQAANDVLPEKYQVKVTLGGTSPSVSGTISIEYDP